MRRLKISDLDTTIISIQQEILRSDESRYDHRLHGVLLICSGLSSYEVADILGHSPRTIQGWINRFEKSGFAGLYDRFRSGRPSSLTSIDKNELEIDLRKSPKEIGYQQNLWDGKLLSHHLLKKYNMKLGVRQCQRVFHDLGFRLRKPRGIIARADPEKQRKYKKTPGVGRK